MLSDFWRGMGMRFLIVSVSVFAVGSAFITVDGDASESPGAVFVLTPDQRVDFLRYYAPLILKRAEKGDGPAGIGQDWITNFNFDNDGWSLANNARVWRDELAAFITDGAHPDWQIRPTLYSAAIEFMEDGEKSLILLYHIYHARQEGNIHDWERVEIRLDGVGPQPGSGEKINYCVITEHSRHKGRRYPDDAVNFYATPEGMHVMIWQAQWAETGSLYRGELHWVGNPPEEIASMLADPTHDALVDVDRFRRQVSFDYIFVPEFDETAVTDWGAEEITPCNASEMVANWEKTVLKVSETKRVTYELQDLADLFITHWDDGTENKSWKEPLIPVLLETPIGDEYGGVEVPAGMQSFYCVAVNDLHDDVKHGYPRKHWFWGVYRFGKDDHFYDEAFDKGGPNPDATRADRNGLPDCLGSYWWQHDYYAHSGEDSQWARSTEKGEWLPRGWHTPEAGGFDGRWEQVFPDERMIDCAG